MQAIATQLGVGFATIGRDLVNLTKTVKLKRANGADG